MDRKAALRHIDEVRQLLAAMDEALAHDDTGVDQIADLFDAIDDKLAETNAAIYGPEVAKQAQELASAMIDAMHEAGLPRPRRAKMAAIDE